MIAIFIKINNNIFSYIDLYWRSDASPLLSRPEKAFTPKIPLHFNDWLIPDSVNLLQEIISLLNSKP